MSAAAPQDGEWRTGLQPEVIAEIEGVIEKFEYLKAYEAQSDTVRGTLEKLGQIVFHCEALIQLFSIAEEKDLASSAEQERRRRLRLSNVGKSAMFDAGFPKGLETGRYELADLAKVLENVLANAAQAVEILGTLHSPTADNGQGAGSSQGRDSDMRAVRADHGLTTRTLSFSSPKDKLGVAVVAALARNGFDCGRYRAREYLKGLLRSIWRSIRPGERPANWDRVVSQRKLIAEWARREPDREAAEQAVRLFFDRSSHFRGKMRLH